MCPVTLIFNPYKYRHQNPEDLRLGSRSNVLSIKCVDDFRQRVTVFLSDDIKSSVVHTEPGGSILFLHPGSACVVRVMFFRCNVR